MNKTCFLLISVIDDEILTEQFRDLNEAQLCVMDEMMRYCRPRYYEELTSIVKDAITNSDSGLWMTEYGYEHPSGDMGFSKYEAYMNDEYGLYACSWRIVEITID